jgi:CheY-like chemotaxis protein
MSKKILVVEDEQIIADDISRSLKGLGYSLAAIAVSGDEALYISKREGKDKVSAQ